jgi:hypothetical protein
MRATECYGFAGRQDFSAPASVEDDGWGVFDVGMTGAMIEVRTTPSAINAQLTEALKVLGKRDQLLNTAKRLQSSEENTNQFLIIS